MEPTFLTNRPSRTSGLPPGALMHIGTAGDEPVSILHYS